MEEQQDSQIILYTTDDHKSRIEVRLEGETVWLTQAQMAELFQTTKQNISLHLQNIYDEGELHQKATVKEYLTVQKEGKRQVNRNILTHSGKISHEIAVAKAESEYEKFYNRQIEVTSEVEKHFEDAVKKLKEIKPQKKTVKRKKK